MADLAPWDRHLSLSCVNAMHMRCNELAICLDSGGFVACLCWCHVKVDFA